MKKILLLLAFIGAFYHLQSTDKLQDLTVNFTSKESLQEELREKQQQRQWFTESFRKAQLNAPYCGGRKRVPVMTEETKNKIRDLDEAIVRLRKQIAQKK